MSLKVIIVVLIAALLHATWNFLVKRSADTYQGMSSVVIGHNHLSGDTTPSKDDRVTVSALILACLTMHITVEDSIIVGPDGNYSSAA